MSVDSNCEDGYDMLDCIEYDGEDAENDYEMLDCIEYDGEDSQNVQFL